MTSGVWHLIKWKEIPGNTCKLKYKIKNKTENMQRNSVRNSNKLWIQCVKMSIMIKFKECVQRTQYKISECLLVKLKKALRKDLDAKHSYNFFIQLFFAYDKKTRKFMKHKTMTNYICKSVYRSHDRTCFLSICEELD